MGWIGRVSEFSRGVSLVSNPLGFRMSIFRVCLWVVDPHCSMELSFHVWVMSLGVEVGLRASQLFTWRGE